MINKIKYKLRSTSGMSLGEILVVILILLLATGTVTSTMMLANKHYKSSLRNSEANVLYSTLSDIITNELSYASEVYVYPDGEVKKFQGNDYQERGYLSSFYTVDGSLVFANLENTNEYRELVSKAFYRNGLIARVDSCTFNKQDEYFTVNLVILADDDTPYEIINKSFDVTSINGLKGDDVKEVN